MIPIILRSLPIPQTLAVRAGLPVSDAGPVTLTSDLLAALDQDARDDLAMLLADDEQSKDWLRGDGSPSARWFAVLPETEHVALVRAPHDPIAWQAASAAVRRVRAEQAERERRADRHDRDRRIAAALAAPLSVTADQVLLGRYLPSDLAAATPDQRAAIATRLAEGEPERRRLIAEMEAQRGQEAAKTAAKAEREAAKTAHLRQRLGELAPDLAAQWDDGLLCRDEALRVIAAAVLDPIAPETAAEICDDRACRCAITGVTCVSPEAYGVLRALRQRLPAEARIDDYDRVIPHIGSPDEAMDDDAVPEPIYRARLTVTDGPLTFTRRIDLTPPRA